MEIFDYCEEELNHYSIDNQNIKAVEELVNIQEGYIRWINIDTQIEQNTLDAIIKLFNINQLIADDLRNNNIRAKIEDYEDYLHIIVKMIYYQEHKLIVEHMNFIMGERYVISFGDTKGDIFDRLRERISKQGSKIRCNKADFLMYSILDTIIDGYFDVLESIGETVGAVEDKIIDSAKREWLEVISRLKKTLIYIYRYVWPLREVLSRMEKERLISDYTEPYIRDIYSHMVQVIETIETNREILSGLTEIYISNTSNRLNEIMKVLTIISTIFIPLTFISGIYGMNFNYMPELGMKFGYPMVILVMVIISGLMVLFFKKKKWF